MSLKGKVSGTTNEFNEICDRYGNGIRKRYSGTTEWSLNVYYEKIDGKFAYCLDPGLGIAKTYTEDTDADKSSNKIMYGAVYNSNFAGKEMIYCIGGSGSEGFKYESFKLNEGDEYVIKQFMVWAIANNKVGPGEKFSSDVVIDIRAALLKKNKYPDLDYFFLKSIAETQSRDSKDKNVVDKFAEMINAEYLGNCGNLSESEEKIEI